MYIVKLFDQCTYFIGTSIISIKKTQSRRLREENTEKMWDRDYCAEDLQKVWDSHVLPVSCWVTRSQRSRFRTAQLVPYTEWWPLPTSKHTYTHTQGKKEVSFITPSANKSAASVVVGIHLVKISVSRSLESGGKCLYHCFREHKTLTENTKSMWHQHTAQRLWLHFNAVSSLKDTESMKQERNTFQNKSLCIEFWFCGLLPIQK